MNFESALSAMKEGKRVYREGWNGKGMYVEIQRPGKGSKESLPYLSIKTTCHNYVPWTPPSMDLLAEDWRLMPSATSS